MKAKSMVSATGLVAFCWLAAPAAGQTPGIGAFGRDGVLSWTNITSNLWYTVQWASSPVGSNAWHTNYASLADIQSTSSVIAVDVPAFFRVFAASNRAWFPAPVPKTGQTNVFRVGDDGYYRAGVTWPSNRFVAAGGGDATNLILDCLSGLVWPRDANLPGGLTNWTDAISFCTNLSYGGCTNWRLPNVVELYSLCSYATNRWPCLPQGHPFANVQDKYWSGTSSTSNQARLVWIGSGDDAATAKTNVYAYVWPVSGPPEGTPGIASAHESGRLTWTNAATGLYYTVQWASGNGTNAWPADGSMLLEIWSTSSTASVSVPLSYRIVAGSNRTVYPAPAAKTGQTNSFDALGAPVTNGSLRDDGYCRKGVAWPSNRFSVGTNGEATNTVVDNLTGLMWARDADLAGGGLDWFQAVDFCTNLQYGGYDDWRLPNANEMRSLLDYRIGVSTKLPAGHPFVNVIVEHWTSTSQNGLFAVGFSTGGGLGSTSVSDLRRVWPVRGGL